MRVEGFRGRSSILPWLVLQGELRSRISQESSLCYSPKPYNPQQALLSQATAQVCEVLASMLSCLKGFRVCGVYRVQGLEFGRVELTGSGPGQLKGTLQGT